MTLLEKALEQESYELDPLLAEEIVICKCPEDYGLPEQNTNYCLHENENGHIIPDCKTCWGREYTE